MSSSPAPPAAEARGSGAGTEGHRGGALRRRGAAGDAEGHPAGGPPGPEMEEEEDAVFGGDGVSMGDEDEDEAAETSAEAPGCGVRMAGADGGPRLNTCCICWEPWASCGVHRICCIPCGHVYGRSCLASWLIRCGGLVARCPGCGEQFEHKHILNLYPPTEHIWDDCCHKQATRHSEMEEEATRQVVQAVMEEVARKDRVIAKMEGKIARMTLIHEIRITLTKIRETEKRIALLKWMNLMLSGVMAVLLCASVVLFTKL